MSQRKLNAYIFSRDATKHLAWLKNVFDAEALEVHHFEDSTRIMHCCIGLNGARMMMSDYEQGKSEKHATDRGMALCLNYTGIIATGIIG